MRFKLKKRKPDTEEKEDMESRMKIAHEQKRKFMLKPLDFLQGKDVVIIEQQVVQKKK